MNIERLKMSLGEAVFTQRSMRKLKPDALPDEDIRLLLEAAVKAPNGGNHQLGRFLVDCSINIPLLSEPDASATELISVTFATNSPNIP